MYVDVHAHLDHMQMQPDFNEVLARAEQAGLKAIITNGVNRSTNRKCLALAKKYPFVKAALGIYPIDALKKEMEQGIYPDEPGTFDVAEELAFIRKQKEHIIALGEIGLDNYMVPSDLREQKDIFAAFIEMGQKMDKPLIVHTRKAEQEVIEMLISAKAKKVVLHCFTGSMKLVKQAEEHGFSFSIPPNIVFSTHFQEMVKRVNINQLLTETDCPYLGPKKGERNEPMNVVETVKKIAALKGFDETETRNTIFMNYQRMFG